MSFESDPRSYALEMVENGLVNADHLLLCALKYMSHDDVRDMLHANELAPCFDWEEEEEEENEEWECTECGWYNAPSEDTCLECGGPKR